ncbi:MULTISPECIES: Rpp14/Pop5 family protein [unclassified Methanoregula]|uniref:Rpp14/Pop5 family protein n=1 Tax=unclassified Methanoregula TaxID=2649730 RepID=UPI0009CA3963|nr:MULTISPECIES: Rpp14/Pop5 family protein [unclassified Methanoregula]OPX65529.1 MAG: Ribonuclease P protein component 2 [Methanoregula sp. PtaB.Bin085]OPY35809.1 MAG: Ribonuclease P protein component 2 [Methanoregula sp. PtaU1.Bin006]
MSPRPPTLRENRRYILVRVEPAGTVVDQKELYYAIADAVTSLWGDAAGGVIMQAVVAAEEEYVMIRCLRGTERELAIALSTVTSWRDTRLALRILAASGTIESLRERIRKQKEQAPGDPSPEPEGRLSDKREVLVTHCNGQKVDVIEKGFKNAHRLFVTRSDLENS